MPPPWLDKYIFEHTKNIDPRNIGDPRYGLSEYRILEDFAVKLKKAR